MFRIVCFVDDKNLAPIMHGLAGLAKGLEVVPVAEAKSTKQLANGNGSLTDLFGQYLSKNDGAVTPTYVKEFLRSVGRSPGSVQHVLKNAAATRLIAKHGKGTNMTYTRVGK